MSTLISLLSCSIVKHVLGSHELIFVNFHLGIRSQKCSLNNLIFKSQGVPGIITHYCLKL